MLTTRKGACGAGRDSKPLHLHHWRNRERWRRRDGLRGKKTSIRSAWTFLFLDIILSIPLTFLGLSVCPSRWPDFSCDSAERKRADKERKRDRSAGRRLVCTRRGERVSGHRVCVFARWGPKTELDCPAVLPRRKKKGKKEGLLGGDNLTSFCGALEKIRFSRIAGSLSDRTLDSTHVWSGKKLDACGFASPQDAGECSCFYCLLFYAYSDDRNIAVLKCAEMKNSHNFPWFSTIWNICLTCPHHCFTVLLFYGFKINTLQHAYYNLKLFLIMY